MTSGVTIAQLYIPKARKHVESPEAGCLRQNETGKDIHRQRIRKNDGEGNGTPLQYSCLEIPWMEEPSGLVHGVSKSQTRLNDFTFIFHFHALEKGMATHSNILAWRIPGTREICGLPSMGSHTLGCDWCDLAAAAAWVKEIRIYFRWNKNENISKLASYS